MKIDFGKRWTNRILDFVILDGFVTCKGLDRFRRLQRVQWNVWN